MLGPRRQGHRIVGTTARLFDVGQCLGQCKGALARGIDQPFVGHTIAHEHLGRHFKQITRYKCSSCQRFTILP